MRTKRQLLLIDPLEKLVIKKDSSLMLATSMQKAGLDTAVMFLDDLFWSNRTQTRLKVHRFHGELDSATHYLTSFKLADVDYWPVDRDLTLHMRLDPPFDARYLRTLWLLRSLQSEGAQVVNDPGAIALFNEKLTALRHPSSLPSFIGHHEEALGRFLESLESAGQKGDYLIIKPLDMFQGYGVVKVPWQREEVLKTFRQELGKSGAPLIVQPYASKVESGETRAIFFKGIELGSILKVPPKGQYLANIAQGASYSACTLSAGQLRHCQELCRELSQHGIDWVAFDLLGDAVSEVNVTCPGLLVEVSSAHKKNLAEVLIAKL